MLHACAAICIDIQLGGYKASPPNRVESKVMTAAKRHILVRGKSQKNRLLDNAATLFDGKEAFSHDCPACHGSDGQNTGVRFASLMSPPLSSGVGQTYTDRHLKWVIDYGLWPSGMPGSKDILSDDEIWSIVVYLHHLPPAGSLSEPEMYSH
jgi:cytochrome c553